MVVNKKQQRAGGKQIRNDGECRHAARGLTWDLAQAVRCHVVQLLDSKAFLPYRTLWRCWLDDDFLLREVNGSVAHHFRDDGGHAEEYDLRDPKKRIYKKKIWYKHPFGSLYKVLCTSIAVRGFIAAVTYCKLLMLFFSPRHEWGVASMGALYRLMHCCRSSAVGKKYKPASRHRAGVEKGRLCSFPCRGLTSTARHCPYSHRAVFAGFVWRQRNVMTD